MARHVVTAEFFAALAELGIEVDDTRRVIIDIKSGDPIIIYVEKYVDKDSVLNVVRTLKDLEVQTVLVGKEEIE